MTGEMFVLCCLMAPLALVVLLLLAPFAWGGYVAARGVKRWMQQVFCGLAILCVLVPALALPARAEDDQDNWTRTNVQVYSVDPSDDRTPGVYAPKTNYQQGGGAHEDLTYTMSMSTTQAKTWALASFALLGPKAVALKARWPFYAVTYVLDTIQALCNLTPPTNGWEVNLNWAVPADPKMVTVAVPSQIMNELPRVKTFISLLIWLGGAWWLLRAFSGFDAAGGAGI